MACVRRAPMSDEELIAAEFQRLYALPSEWVIRVRDDNGTIMYDDPEAGIRTAYSIARYDDKVWVFIAVEPMGGQLLELADIIRVNSDFAGGRADTKAVVSAGGVIHLTYQLSEEE